MHLGLSDITGYVPRLLGLQRGFMGYSRDYTDEQLWGLILRYLFSKLDNLIRYQNWGCLMGTSIQAKPGESGKVSSSLRSI